MAKPFNPYDPATKEQLAVIHILQRGLDWTDQEYHTVLSSVFRVESSKAMTTAVANVLIAHMQGLVDDMAVTPE